MASKQLVHAQSSTFRTINLDAELRRARNADHGATGRIINPLATLPGLRLLLVSMQAGSAWPEHCTPGRITVQPLAGHIRVRTAESEVDLCPGSVAAFAASVKHDVVAVTDSAFLLTVARPDLD